MKRLSSVRALSRVSVLVLATVIPATRGQTTPVRPVTPQMSPEMMSRYGLMPVQAAPTFPPEPVFDLDFPGGGPTELVAMIREQLPEETPFNVIIPEEHVPVSFPSLKMRAVTVSSLFEAISEATKRRVRVPVPAAGSAFARRLAQLGEGMPATASEATVSAGFRRMGGAGSPVWVFYTEGPLEETPPSRICRFFQLKPYLEHCSVEDITTAIRTGYTLLRGPTAELKFHEDTSLLIAVGSEEALSLIDAVLRELAPPPPEVDPTTGQPLPSRSRKSSTAPVTR